MEFMKINKKMVSATLLALVLCANISLKGADSRGEKRASEDRDDSAVIADTSLSSENGLHSLVEVALLGFANDTAEHPREVASAVVVEGGASKEASIVSGKRKRDDIGGATGQPVAKRARASEVPYVCGIGECEFKTAYLGSIKRHQAIHRGEKPFVCDFEGCAYASVRADNLKTHARTHFVAKPYVCHIYSCKFRAAELDILEEHTKEHLCDFPGCCYTVASIGDLEIHRKKRHSVGAGLSVAGVRRIG